MNIHDIELELFIHCSNDNYHEDGLNSIAGDVNVII